MFNIENLNDEYFTKLGSDEVLDIKELPLYEKGQCFRFFFDSEILTNKAVLYNIFLAIDGIDGLSDEELASEKVFFSSKKEYETIIHQVRYEINDFCSWIVEFYLNILAGLSATSEEALTTPQITHVNFIPYMTPKLLSRLLVKYKDRIEIWNIKPVMNAEELFNKIHIKEEVTADGIDNR